MRHSLVPILATITVATAARAQVGVDPTDNKIPAPQMATTSSTTDGVGSPTGGLGPGNTGPAKNVAPTDMDALPTDDTDPPVDLGDASSKSLSGQR